MVFKGKRGAGAALMVLALASPFLTLARSVTNAAARVDALVEAKLLLEGIEPSAPCTDEVFFRRVYLDMMGTLPTPLEVNVFLRSKHADKRSNVIESLFERDEYADYWSMKWCDLLRVKSEFPSNLWPNAVQAYHRWLWAAMRDDMAYDEFARALLTSSGSNFRVAPVNFYRALAKREPPEMADAAMLLFMGVRSDGFTPEQRMGLAAFFGSVGYKKTAEWKEEIVYYDASKKLLDPETKQPVAYAFPDGQSVKMTPGQDPRRVFADWLIRPENKWFSRNIANRVWFWLLGRGFVQEPDDFRAENPASNPALLDFLAEELVASGWDLQHLFRVILNSQTYQRSALPNESNAADDRYFSRYTVRRLEAEVLIDAICQITGTKEQYSSAIPEPFTWIPEEQHSIALADGSITSPFLDLFGRPPRDTGYELERNNTPSSAQALHLLNSTHIKTKLESGVLGLNRTIKMIEVQQKKAKKNKQTKKAKPAVLPYGYTWCSENPDSVVTRLYMGILSRKPTAAERKLALNYLKKAPSARKGVTDVAWALVNSGEFLTRH